MGKLTVAKLPKSKSIVPYRKNVTLVFSAVNAVEFQQVSKSYAIYDAPSGRLKASVGAFLQAFVEAQLRSAELLAIRSWGEPAIYGIGSAGIGYVMPPPFDLLRQTAQSDKRSSDRRRVPSAAFARRWRHR